MKRMFAAAAVLVLLGLYGAGGVLAQTANSFSPHVDGAGRISLPEDFRSWAYLGSWAIYGGEDGATGFHNVYTQPETVAAFRKTGKFPDGAVLVKELLGAASGDMTTGRVSWAAAVEGWFIMVKDAEGRFPGNPLWGDGWGWALFYADDPVNSVTRSYKDECLECHIPARDDDWIYTRGYPVLHD